MLFHPESVAVIGASSNPLKPGGWVTKNILDKVTTIEEKENLAIIRLNNGVTNAVSSIRGISNQCRADDGRR